MDGNTDLPILFDEELDQNMVEFFENVKNVTEFEGAAIFLCTLTPVKEDAIELQWACDTDEKYVKVARSELQNVQFCSNLHTLVSTSRVVHHPKVIFAGLNCIRKHLSRTMVVVDPENIKTGTSRVFIVMSYLEKI